MARRIYLVAFAVTVPLVGIGIHNSGFADHQNPSTHPTAGETDDHASSIGRYQLAAFGKDGNHGYYILDTATGELWSNYRDNKPSRISGSLAN